MGNFVKNRKLSFGGNNHIVLPAGTTADRPDFPMVGSFRYNISIAAPEFFNGFTFVELSQAGAVDMVVDSFDGDGSTLTFTLTEAPSGADQVIAFIGAIYQNPDTYSISGFDITFTSPPPTGEKINVIQAMT